MVEAAGFITRLKELLAAQFRYTISLAAGAVALSVNALEQFGQPERPWLVVSWACLLLVILTGVAESWRLKGMRNRVLERFGRGDFDGTPGFWETFRFLAESGVSLLFPDRAATIGRLHPWLAAASISILAGSVV